jgi:hypothetical protein
MHAKMRKIIAFQTGIISSIIVNIIIPITPNIYIAPKTPQYIKISRSIKIVPKKAAIPKKKFFNI